MCHHGEVRPIEEVKCWISFGDGEFEVLHNIQE